MLGDKTARQIQEGAPSPTNSQSSTAYVNGVLREATSSGRRYGLRKVGLRRGRYFFLQLSPQSFSGACLRQRSSLLQKSIHIQERAPPPPNSQSSTAYVDGVIRGVTSSGRRYGLRKVGLIRGREFFLQLSPQSFSGA